MDIDGTLEGDVTEADTDTDSISPGQKKSHGQQKAAIPSSEPSLPPVAKKRKVQNIVASGSDVEDGDEDMKPTSKGKSKAVVQDSDSDGGLPAGRGRGRGSAVTRVKQPLKRGGRRL